MTQTDQGSYYIPLDEALRICDVWAVNAMTPQGKQIARAIRRELESLRIPEPTVEERKRDEHR